MGETSDLSCPRAIGFPSSFDPDPDSDFDIDASTVVPTGRETRGTLRALVHAPGLAPGPLGERSLPVVAAAQARRERRIPFNVSGEAAVSVASTALSARVPIVPVHVPDVVFAKTSSFPWSGSIRLLVYANVYRFAVNVYGLPAIVQNSAAEPRPRASAGEPSRLRIELAPLPAFLRVSVPP